MTELPGALLPREQEHLASSNRRISAPADLMRSRRGSTPRECPGCGGEWLTETRAGPVVRHQHYQCPVLP